MKTSKLLVAVSLVAGGAAMAVLVVGDAKADVRYTVTDLGALPGCSNSQAKGINSSGQIVGISYGNGHDEHGFLYSNGTMTDLSTLGAGFGGSSANAINDSGQIVGWSWELATGRDHAFLYSNGTMADLSTASVACAYSINNSGQIAGQSAFPTSTGSIGHACLYSNGTTTDLTPLSNSFISCAARGINDHGQVVGNVVTNDPYTDHAFLYSNGTMTDLGVVPHGFDSEAYGINDGGQVVGVCGVAGVEYPGGPFYHAFLYSDGTMTDLGTLGGDYSWAYSINASGQVVGWAQVDQVIGHAFLCSNGIMIDLNDLIDPSLGWELDEAHATNNNGQIVGYGVNPSGQTHAFLLTPVPEPATLAFLALGGLALARRR